MSTQTTEVPTPEEIQERSRTALRGMFGAPMNKEEPKIEEKVEATPPVETPPTETPPAAPVEKTEAEKQADLIRQTATATADQIAERMKPAPQSTPEPEPRAVVLPEFGKEDKADYEALLAAEAESPEKFAGKAQQFADFVKKNYEYQDAWIANNPGKDFDPKDDEHSAWYEANQSISEDEIKDARAEVRFAEMAQKRMAPLLEKEKKKVIEEAVQQSVPVVAKIFTDNVVKLVELVNPELVAHMKDDKGVLSIGEDSRERVAKADPIAAREIALVVDSVRPLIFDLEKSAIPALGFRLNPATNERHAEIDSFRKQAEAEIMAKPEAERMVDGKPFVTMDTYHGQLALIRKTTPKSKLEAELQKYNDSVTTISIDQIEDKIVRHHAEKAKKIIDDIDSVAQRKYGQSPKPGEAAKPGAAPAARPGSGKPASPSVSSRSEQVTSAATGAVTEKTLAQQATNSMFGR